MKYSAPYIGMKVMFPSLDPNDGRSGEIFELHAAPSTRKRRSFDMVHVRWNSGQMEWVRTEQLEADPAGPSRYQVRRAAFDRIEATRSRPSALEQWRKDRRGNMKAIVVIDIENLAAEHRRQAEATKDRSPSHENWAANAELLALAAEVLKEIR